MSYASNGQLSGTSGDVNANLHERSTSYKPHGRRSRGRNGGRCRLLCIIALLVVLVVAIAVTFGVVLHMIGE